MFNETITNQIKEFAKLDDSYIDEIEIYVFPQMWGSTALGYSGIGGSAMTGSHTIIFYNTYTGNVMLSYGARFIKLNTPNRLFFEDISKGRIESECKLSKYRRED